MRNGKRSLVFAAVAAAALIAAPALYAQDTQGPSGSMMRGGMMGGGMMGGMSRMMDHCGSMMQGGSRTERPNDQWRRGARPAPQDDH
jgi:hypothetical protein